MVVTKFLAHKDVCQLPGEDEFVMVGGRIGVVVDARPGHEMFPLFEVQMPSGRSNVFRASEISRLDDQDDGRRRFFE